MSKLIPRDKFGRTRKEVQARLERVKTMSNYPDLIAYWEERLKWFDDSNDAQK